MTLLMMMKVMLMLQMDEQNIYQKYRIIEVEPWSLLPSQIWMLPLYLAAICQ